MAEDLLVVVVPYPAHGGGAVDRYQARHAVRSSAVSPLRTWQ
ncbi:hypothetical protein [Streptomyces antibioticus]